MPYNRIVLLKLSDSPDKLVKYYFKLKRIAQLRKFINNLEHDQNQ